MPITESSARRLILQAGWTCLVLDKVAGKARLERKFLFWRLKPAEARLSAHIPLDRRRSAGSSVGRPSILY